MNKPKIPSQYSIEELLESLETVENSLENDLEAKALEYDDNILAFLSNYRITPGDNLVAKELLRRLYVLYSGEKISSMDFTSKMGKYIDHKGKFFNINLDIFAISKEIYSIKDIKKEKRANIYQQKHFHLFINENNIKAGTFKVREIEFYEFYRNFCQERKLRVRLSKEVFYKFSKLHLKRNKINGYLYFRVDENTFKLLKKGKNEAE